MKRPDINDFKPDGIYDGDDMADWYEAYYKALEQYVSWLENQIKPKEPEGITMGIDKDYGKDNPEFAILIISKGNWGKGRTLQEAMDNTPGFDSREPVSILIVAFPPNMHYVPEHEGQSAYDQVRVAGNRIQRPMNSRIYRLNKTNESVRLAKIRS